jgi:hypothetical protein
MNGRTVVGSRGVAGVELPVRLFVLPDVFNLECAG